MRSEVAVGGLLSGGMDSSCIACVVGRDFPTVPFKTFTIYYKGADQMDERPWASEVPSAYSNIKPTYHAPSDRDVAGGFDAVSKANDVPLRASPAISATFSRSYGGKWGQGSFGWDGGGCIFGPIGWHMTGLSAARSKRTIAESAQIASRRPPGKIDGSRERGHAWT